MEDKKFLGGKSGISRVQFSERTKYLEFIKEMDIEFLDTLYDRKLYGFLNKDYEIIAPVANARLFGPYAGRILGLNYTVSAFNKFRDFYLDISTNGGVVVPELIAELKPTKSFADFDEAYQSYLRLQSLKISAHMESEGYNKFIPFSEFVEVLNKELFSEDLRETRVSKSGFALSDSCSVYSTGLYVDLGKDYSPQMDDIKVQLVTDPGFQCYVEYAERFGFKVDFNCPWRIALDLESTIAREEILNNRPQSQFFDFYSDVCTLKVAHDDLWAVKSFYELYYVQYCTNIGIQTLSANFSNIRMEYWLECLLLNRFRELGLLQERSQRTELYDETLIKVIDIYTLYGLQSNIGAISFINNFSASILKLISEGS